MSVKQNRWLCLIASVGFAFTRITAAQDCGLAQPAFCETFETNISSGYPNAVLNLDLLIDFDLGRIFASSFEAK